MSAAAGLMQGAGDVWHGFFMLLRQPSLWFWALIPFALNIILLTLLCWGTWHFFGGWLEQYFQSKELWHHVIGWITGVVFWVALAFIVIFSFIPLATLIAAPFNDFLSEKVERLCGIGPTEKIPPIRSLLVGFAASLRLTLLTSGLLLCTLPLHLILGFGSLLAMAASVAITVRYLSLEFTSYSMDRRNYSYARRKYFLHRHRSRTIGLDGMAFFLMMIPIVNALFIPVSAVAGTLLFCNAQLGVNKRLRWHKN